MNIIIPGLVFSKGMNIKLLEIIKTHAPNLYKFISTSYAESNSSNFTEKYGCTAFETLQLKNCGFKNEKNKLFSSGLGPFLAKTKPNDHDPVWLLELVHLDIGINGAMISNPIIPNLDKQQSLALLNSILPVTYRLGFKIEFISPERWRLFSTNIINIESFSPKAIAGKNINNFLEYHHELSNWRRLLNEIQIIWNEHAVNSSRSRNGLDTINSLWLYGGALSWDFKKNENLVISDLENIRIYDNIELWIKKLKNIDLLLKNYLYYKDNKQRNNIKLILLGDDRSVELSSLNDLNIFKRIIYSRKNKWQYHLN